MIYPSLFTDPGQVRIRDAQCSYPGGIFSIQLDGGKRAAFEFLRRLRIAKNAVSLGGVETLVCHPATTTHSEMSEEELARYGVGDDLVRISVGIEHWRDLLVGVPGRPRRSVKGGRGGLGQPATARASSTMERGEDPSALLLTMTSPSFPARTARRRSSATEARLSGSGAASRSKGA